MDHASKIVDIVIADDHRLFRQGLRKLLESEADFRVVGEASDGEEAIALVSQLRPNILLLDLAMPRMPGLVALGELNKLAHETRVIILAADVERQQVVDALQRGAHGVVLKQSALEALVKGIRSVTEGRHWVDQESVPDLVHAIRTMAPQPPPAVAKMRFGLSSRELEVIELIVAGYTNKDLAAKLQISEYTAKHHLTNIYDKLGVSNRLELVLYAFENHLVHPG